MGGIGEALKPTSEKKWKQGSFLGPQQDMNLFGTIITKLHQQTTLTIKCNNQRACANIVTNLIHRGKTVSMVLSVYMLTDVQCNSQSHPRYKCQNTFSNRATAAELGIGDHGISGHRASVTPKNTMNNNHSTTTEVSHRLPLHKQ